MNFLRFFLSLMVATLFASLLNLSNAKAEVPSVETMNADQAELAVTVYNNDRALVREQRKVKLPRGEVRLKFMGVPERILPETVSLHSVSSPNSLRVIEQNYEYDLISPSKLMEKYVGKTVRLINKDTKLNFYEVDAKLLSVNEGPVYQVGNEIYLGHPGIVVLPELPAELIAKPTLICVIENEHEEQMLEATYLTSGMSWRADYVIKYREREEKMDIDGWVTLNNNSGATYDNARVKLVAGDVNIVRAPAVDMMMEAGARKMVQMVPPMPEEEAFAEYHLYTLPKRTTIKQNQSKQVSLLTGSNVGVKKIYEYRGNVSYYFSKIEPIKNENIDTFLVFKNSEANGLGMPLPEGIIRVYQEDKEGTLQFAGEDRIKHTPKDEEVRLRLGKAFDVVGERIQKDFQKLGPEITESEFEVIIRNHKTVDIVVDVVEPMRGDWNIVSSSIEYEKKDAFTVVFHLPVKADSKASLTYRVRVR
ncbi:MAG: DUF4139 domain-containing protein [Candidatus Hydrogenedentes bacterium]|nr:DUF4139 domain-containing protein [Candidatus Hydrogenedentota bacterium]